MTWSLETSNGYESDKIAHLVVPYTRGKCLDIGCGTRKVWPRLIGVDTRHHFGSATDCNIESDGRDLSVFADESMDGVFSSHTLEHVALTDVPAVLKEWARVIKPDGYLTLYLPSANLYPKCGEEGANPDHKWDISPGDVERILPEATDCGWTQLEAQERDRGDEYSLYLVFQKRTDGKFIRKLWRRNPEGKKRALVVRFGAIGDQIMVSSILPLLKRDGFHVTYNTTPQGYEILKHDPNVDEWMLQDKDQVPNEQLGPWWEALAGENRYDRMINLCESVEGTFLALPGRINASYTHEARERIMGTVNYLEHAHRIAGVSDAAKDIHPRFFMGPGELKWAKDKKGELTKGAPLIAWAINGSSPHKVWPWIHIVTAWLLKQTDCHVALLADPDIGKQLQDGILGVIEREGLDLSRVHGLAGDLTIRQALSLVQVADCVVGPETGTLNAVCMEAVPKVIYLSHSSHENLTKHWVNTTVLTPPPKSCACFPCHLLHYDWSSCHQDEKTHAALCASRIPPEKIFEAIMGSINIQKAA